MTERIRNREKFRLSSSVFVFLLDGDNILLLLRSNTGWFDNHYTVPCGMKDPREPARWAAKREVQEEIGVELDVSDLRYVHFMHCRTTGEEWYGLYYLLTKWQGEPALREPHKHGELKWVPITELPKNMSPYVLQAIQRFKTGVVDSEFGWELSDDATEEDYKNYYSEQ